MGCDWEGKGSPYSIAERRVPELIPVLGSHRADDVSHKPGGRLPLLSATGSQLPSQPLTGLLPVCLRLLPDSVVTAGSRSLTSTRRIGRFVFVR